MTSSPLMVVIATAALFLAAAAAAAFVRLRRRDADAAWQQRVIAFAVDLRGSLSTSTLHETIASRLPAMLGVDQLWIESRVGGRRTVIAAPAGTRDISPAMDPLTESPGDWATFPLRTGDTVVGVIGVPIAQHPLGPGARRALAALAPLLGDSLQTAHTIAALRELSTIDSLTGCATRQEGIDRLRAELKRAQRSNQQVAVLMLDLDHFKNVNDRYGHQCGDSVLGAIGRTLMQTLRGSDLRCRWGGEEFLVALPDTGLDQARRVAVTLARRVSSTAVEYDSARIQVTASIGVTIALSGEDDPDAVLARADAALYHAKADGRNCIRVMLANLEDGSMTLVTPPALPFRDRRNPEQPDRRQHRGPGRRATDFAYAGRRSAPDIAVTAADTQVRATTGV